jgi:hyperosmotically inducible periplasmic protein
MIARTSIALASWMLSMKRAERSAAMGHPKACLRWLSLLLVVMTLSGCAGLFSGREGVEEEPREDVVMAMKVKAALIENAQLSAAAIAVEASNHQIRLSGFVETESQRQLASDVANQVPGVTAVINDIEVK